MRLEGIAAVRAEKHDAAARLQDADHLVDGEQIVVDVLNDLVAEDQVEVLIPERQILSARSHDVRIRLPADLFGGVSAFVLDLDADRVFGSQHKAGKVRADAAAVFKDAAVDALAGVFFDQVHAALLSRAPHVGRFAALGGFAGMFLSVSDIFHS